MCRQCPRSRCGYVSPETLYECVEQPGCEEVEFELMASHDALTIRRKDTTLFE